MQMTMTTHLISATRYQFTDDNNNEVQGGRIFTLSPYDENRKNDAAGFQVTSMTCDYSVIEQVKQKIKEFPADVELHCVQKIMKDSKNRDVVTIHVTALGNVSSFGSKSQKNDKN